MTPQIKAGITCVETWLAYGVALLGALSASGVLTQLDPKYGALLALVSSVALMLQRGVLKFQAAAGGDPASVPQGGEVIPKTPAEATAALTAAGNAVLAQLDKPKA